MATTNRRRVQHRRVLFARTGRMHFYSGPRPGDERAVGGGLYNESEIGHEVYNFQVTRGRLYGFFQPPMVTHLVALERIDPEAAGKDRLNPVLVVFVAPRPEGHQVIVGWYKDAEVFRNEVQRSPGKPRGFGHFLGGATQLRSPASRES
jgi:hypothetical protein